MALLPTRTSTAATWASFTGTLANGEVTLETDTGVVKVGDGLTLYAQLPVADNQITSAARALIMSDETGTGAQAYATSPTLVTPVLGVATATSVNKVTITAPTTAATLTLITGSSLITAGAFATTLTATATTGVTLPTTGTLSTLAGAESLSNKTLVTPIISGFAVHSSTNAITASATQTQAAGTALTTKINRVVTVVSANDAVTLPAATAGKEIVVINAHATNAIGVFPASGDKVNAIAIDAVYALAAVKTAFFFCAVAGQWNTILTA